MSALLGKKKVTKHLKEYFWIGFFQIIKPLGFGIFIYYLTNFVLGFSLGFRIEFWNFIDGIFPINVRILRLSVTILLLSLPYLYGIYSVSKFANKKRRLRAVKTRSFVRGGGKVVLHRDHGPETSPRPSVAVSRSMDGKEKMISIIVFKLALPEPKPIELKHTRVTDLKFGEIRSYFASFGTDTPSNWGSREWTDKEYYSIPTDEDLLEELEEPSENGNT